MPVPSEPEAVVDASLRALFRPKTVALVGVSRDPRNLGHRYLRHLLAHGFPPEHLQIVHPSAREVLGIATVPGVDDLAEVPDVALVLTPGGPVPELVSELVGAGVRAFNVFANDGPVIDDPDALRSLLRPDGARLLGPNSPGFISAAPPVAAHASQFLGSATLRSRPVGIISHSGAIGGIVARALLEAGSGFDSLICTGNEIDLGLGECLHYLVSEEQPRAIGLFIESVRDFDYFRAGLALAAERGIRVCALKVGWSEAAQRAAHEHTGAETGRVDLFEAELRRAGATLCRDLRELIAMLVVGSLPTPATGGLAIGATSGGLTSVLGDAATEAGLAVPELPGFHNPWDTDIQVVHEPNVVGETWAEALSRDDVGAGVMALSAQTDDTFSGLFEGMGSREVDKPCLVIPYAGLTPELVAKLPPYAAAWEDPATGLRALAWAGTELRGRRAPDADGFEPDLGSPGRLSSVGLESLAAEIVDDVPEVHGLSGSVWLWPFDVPSGAAIGEPITSRVDTVSLREAWTRLGQRSSKALSVTVPPGHMELRLAIGRDPAHGAYATVGVPGMDDVSVLLPADADGVERALLSSGGRGPSPFATLAASLGTDVVSRLAGAIVAVSELGTVRVEPLAVPLTSAGAVKGLAWLSDATADPSRTSS
jgi:predicted CoA-binding protein